jgi:two-component system OmpR family response regulator
MVVADDMVAHRGPEDRVVLDQKNSTGRLDRAAEHLLLDLMLPDGRGIAFLRELRRKGCVTPVIILTALDQISDRIDGLNAGADDYMTKPFDLAELSARLNAVARRYSGNPNPLVEIGDLQIDLAARTIMKGRRLIDLTAREWALFEAFVQRPGRVMSKAQLEDRLYAFGAEVESNTIEVHVSRLRKKLGPDAVHTVRGIGYRLGSAR